MVIAVFVLRALILGGRGYRLRVLLWGDVSTYCDIHLPVFFRNMHRTVALINAIFPFVQRAYPFWMLI